MERVKLSANSGFKGSNMSRTVEEIFESWLDDNCERLIESKVEIEDIVKEALCECVTENFNLDDYDVKETIESEVSNAVSNADIEDKIVELLKDEIAEGTFNEDIRSGIQNAVVLHIDEKLEEVSQDYKAALILIEKQQKQINVLTRDIHNIEKITYRTWSEWFNTLMGWD